ARLWDVASRQALFTLYGFKHPKDGYSLSVNSVAFSPDGRTLATLDRNLIVKLWDVSTGRELRKLNEYTGVSTGSNAMAYSPDGVMLATIVREGVVLWNLVTSQKEIILKGHAQPVTTLAFSPDGKRLATGSADQTAKIWDLAIGQELVTLRGHTSPIYSV